MNTEKISALLANDEAAHGKFVADHEAPFPIHVFSPQLRNLAEHIADVYRAPIAMVAFQILAMISSTLGKGIRLITNHPDPTYGLIFTFLGARPGHHKSSLLKCLKKPLEEFQRDVRKQNRIGVETRLIHENTQKKDWRPSKGDIDREIGKSTPTLLVEHYTQEGLATTLSYNNEFIALHSSDSSGVVDLLRGAKSNGVFQGELLLKGFCGESYDCNKKTVSDEHLGEIRMTVNLLGTNGTLQEFISDDQIKKRGLLSRFLVVQIHDPVPREDYQRRKIDREIFEYWNELTTGFLSKYWGGDKGEPDEVSMTDEAIELLVEFRNECIDQMDELDWLASLPERWAENALRIALILHVEKHQYDPQKHLLRSEGMSDAIILMRWIIAQEMACMEEVKRINPKTEQYKERLFQYLSNHGPTRVRDLKKKRGLLPKGQNNFLQHLVNSGELVAWDGSRSNAPSLRVALPEDDRIPKGVEFRSKL
ncbi:MAG: DUF3987 domain-containing protein [Verrucomicrobia bacterium]|nr:DUF3987 domain-containing protein [Verrucomicrobiota bacterium]